MMREDVPDVYVTQTNINQDRAELTFHAGGIVAADLMVCVLNAVTVNRALWLRDELAKLIEQLQTVERAALSKADELCG
jgi:predicted short-subunit dehydrogenase-like oxidoreductase (DUF2520 family)